MPGRPKRRKLILALSFLGTGLIGAVLLASVFGAVNISPQEILKMGLNRLSVFDFQNSWGAVNETIFFQIRLPRVVGGALVGAALSTAGVLFQGLLRNPMADPYIIGTSAGAALGATIALLLPLHVAFLGFGLVPIAAFAGAALTVIIVYNLARTGGRTPIVSILLAGFVVSALLSAVMAFLISVSERLGFNFRSVYSFLLGSISVTGWSQIAVIAPVIVLGVAGARFYAFHLNALSLGEEGAAYVGVDVERDKTVILALGSLLTAAAVSISGLVGFIGLVAPHAVRLVLGPDHRLLIPCAALAGSAFLVIADLIARTVLAPVEIPVGIVTAMVGGPFFLYLLRNSRREYAF